MVVCAGPTRRFLVQTVQKHVTSFSSQNFKIIITTHKKSPLYSNHPAANVLFFSDINSVCGDSALAASARVFWDLSRACVFSMNRDTTLHNLWLFFGSVGTFALLHSSSCVWESQGNFLLASDFWDFNKQLFLFGSVTPLLSPGIKLELRRAVCGSNPCICSKVEIEVPHTWQALVRMLRPQIYLLCGPATPRTYSSAEKTDSKLTVIKTVRYSDFPGSPAVWTLSF